MNNRSPRRVRISMSTIYCFAALMALLMSVSAFSDTYNFFFSKPKKGGAGQVAPQGDEDSGEEEDAEESPATPPAPSAPAVAAPAAPAAGNATPIIINNNNSFPSQPAPAPAPAPFVPSDPHKDSGPEKTLTTATSSFDGNRRVRLGVSVFRYSGSTWFDGNSADIWTSSAERGAMASLSYGFTRSLGITGYFGVGFWEYSGHISNYYYGGELEFLPFRITVGKVDIIELGLVGGVGSWPNQTIYGGARANLNFDERFGLTAVARTNFHSTAIELGLVTHL